MVIEPLTWFQRHESVLDNLRNSGSGSCLLLDRTYSRKPIQDGVSFDDHCLAKKDEGSI
jgi:hypothetical protein